MGLKKKLKAFIDWLELPTTNAKSYAEYRKIINARRYEAQLLWEEKHGHSIYRSDAEVLANPISQRQEGGSGAVGDSGNQGCH